MTEEYPLKNCEKHPSRMWEWDGYCWICIDCILDKFIEPKMEDYGGTLDDCSDIKSTGIDLGDE